MEKRKIAIIHDWLYINAGAEKVLENILALFPDADLFSLVDYLPESNREFIHNKDVTTSFIQRMPFSRQLRKLYLPLMPLAIENLDLSGYDLILSSSYAVAKGVITNPDQLHICYCHSPIRYAWDLQNQYLQESGLNRGLIGFSIRVILHYLRLWDTSSADRVDYYITNSAYVARRIRKSYRRKAKVIHPPVDVDHFTCVEKKSDYYLTVSRMVPYKKINLIVEAFTQMRDKKLIVIGQGTDHRRLQKAATENIALLGHQNNKIMKQYMQNACAFIFAAEEDFGIVPLEAQACGTPVIAYGRGGVCETVRGLDTEKPTGVFFESQDVASIVNAVHVFESNIDLFNPSECRKNALRFSSESFRRDYFNFVKECWDNWQAEKLDRNSGS